jgi:hypothetical protein
MELTSSDTYELWSRKYRGKPIDDNKPSARFSHLNEMELSRLKGVWDYISGLQDAILLGIKRLTGSVLGIKNGMIGTRQGVEEKREKRRRTWPALSNGKFGRMPSIIYYNGCSTFSMIKTGTGY